MSQGIRVPGGFLALRECLRVANFRLYVIGNVSHGLGIWVLRISIGWLAWELTESPAWLGAMAMAETAPSLVFGLIAGTIVDRVNYIRLMQITQGLSALLSAILAVLVFAGAIGIWGLFFLVLVRGFLMALNRPSRMAFVHHLVGRDLLPPALAIGSIIHNGTRFIGPGLGGFVIVVAGIGWGFATTALLLFAYAAILVAMNVAFEREARERRSMLSEIAGGLSYVVRHHGIRVQLGILFALGILAKPVIDMLPGYAGQVFSMGADGLAMLVTVHGIGATVGGVWLASRAKGIDGMTGLNLASVAATGFVLMLFTATANFWIALVGVALLGFSFIVLTVTCQTLVQSAVDPAFRGRVISVHGIVAMGVPALGAMLLGVLAEHFGLRLPVFVGGVMCVLFWCLLWRQKDTVSRSLETVAHEART